jgi:hypothetical protein
MIVQNFDETLKAKVREPSAIKDKGLLIVKEVAEDNSRGTPASIGNEETAERATGKK